MNASKARPACMALAAFVLMTNTIAANAADCALVIAAYAKADATKRFAVYDADAPDKPSKGTPFMVVMNGQQWVRHYDRPTPLKMVANGYDQTRYAGDSEGAILADAVRADKKHCEPLGNKPVGTATATGWLVRDNSKGKDYGAIEFWIDTATGLPMFHGMPKSEGLKWVYGDAVTAPSK